MKTWITRSFVVLRSVVCALPVVAGLPVHADSVETLDGSIIRGRVIASDGGVINVVTEFAGTIEIKRDQVRTITTDDPIHVALADGNIVKGRITSDAGGLNVAGDGAALQTSPTAIDALWRDGDKSPAEKAADALQRKWAYELAFDLNGRNGNSDRIFIGLSGRAVLQGVNDRLMFYGNYSRAEENDETAQDEAKGGVDYSNFFTEKMSWYVRTELGYDRTKDLDLRSQSAAGLGYTFIKKPTQMLEGRFGLSYRFENYGVNPDFDSAGIDLGLLHSLALPWGQMTNSLNITPSFEDFSNYVITHDSALDLPLKGDRPWKVRVGVKTDYTSEPPPGLTELDWTYYTQLVLNWK